MRKKQQKQSSCWLFWRRWILTSFGLKVGDAMHDDMMQEQRLVVDLYVSGQKTVEVSHIPADNGEKVQNLSDVLF